MRQRYPEMIAVKRVLIVAYFFAPSPTVGARRPLEFYHYLPEFGWEPYVLTIYPVAGGLEPELPRVVRTNYVSPWKWLERRRARSASPGQTSPPAWSLRQASLKSNWRKKLYFLIRHMLPMSSVRMPDATLGWYPFAVKAGQAMLENQDFDVIWSSSGPPTAHLVAARLHHHSNLPWVADFRDLWSSNYQELRYPFFQVLEAKMERHVLASAARIMTISTGLAQLLSEFYGRDIDVVYNGYGETQISSSPPLETEFTIRYTGSLYPEMRDLRPFLQTIAHIKTAEPTFRPRIEFIGPELAWFGQLIQEYGLADMINCLDPVPQAQALTLQQRSTALLLFDWSTSDKPGWLPVKMFEYMRTGRPILEIGSKQRESAATIAKCRAGITTEQPEEIQAVLLSWWREFQQTGMLTSTTDMNQVAQYSRRAQTERLAEIFNTVT